MCTLAVAFQADRRWPIVVAANRDERLARPSETWALRDGAPVRHAAPRDVEAGGTWIGVSARGVFAAVTNFHVGRPADRTKRSRGELVPRALAAPDAAAARAILAALDARAWNPFHLLVADAGQAFLWRFDGEAAALTALGPGLHVVTERSADGVDPRSEVVRARWPLDPAPRRLAELLAQHEPEGAQGRAPPAPERSVCAHPDPRYGTVSSAVLRLPLPAGAARPLEGAELFVADGAPCRTGFEDRSALLAALARAA
jgi:uncharacterized protein with NRDE domain